MLVPLLFGTAMVLVTTFAHAGVLYWLAAALSRMASKTDRALPFRVFLLALSVVLGLHVAEIWLWAAVYMKLGEFADFATALYFSAVTATTLGYGDITLSADWRLLSTFEAMAGLLLFGVTTAFMLQLVRELIRAGRD